MVRNSDSGRPSNSLHLRVGDFGRNVLRGHPLLSLLHKGRLECLLEEVGLEGDPHGASCPRINKGEGHFAVVELAYIRFSVGGAGRHHDAVDEAAGRVPLARLRFDDEFFVL